MIQNTAVSNNQNADNLSSCQSFRQLLCYLSKKRIANVDVDHEEKLKTKLIFSESSAVNFSFYAK